MPRFDEARHCTLSRTFVDGPVPRVTVRVRLRTSILPPDVRAVDEKMQDVSFQAGIKATDGLDHSMARIGVAGREGIGDAGGPASSLKGGENRFLQRGDLAVAGSKKASAECERTANVVPLWQRAPSR